MLTEIFCLIDDFVKTLPKNYLKLPSNTTKKHRNREAKMSLSEIITIIVSFHNSRYRTFKDYYLKHVSIHLRKEFPSLNSYSRFISNSKQSIIPMLLFFQSILGKCSGISFIDSTSLNVCHNRRINRNKVFKNSAARSKTTMGWFYGFKLHFIVNDLGELLAFSFTKGNTDDRVPVAEMCKKIFGKLFGDKGYLGEDLFNKLFSNGIQLITSIKRNMKNKLIPIFDKILPRKRFIIETINDKLKNECQIEHTRHRSPAGFIINLLTGLICYQTSPKKPKLNIRSVPRTKGLLVV
jgi:hypothetical protein